MNRLVGRADELDRLVAAFDGLVSGRSSWVRVTGEPGIGKTRLGGELCGIAAERGAVVLGGRGAELESDLPFGLVIDAFDDHLGSLDKDRLARLCGRQRGELQPLFPALDTVEGARRRVAEDQRYPPTSPFAYSLPDWLIPGRYYWSSTTCTGRTARRSGSYRSSWPIPLRRRY